MIKKTYSQAGQDVFIFNIFDEKKGTFLDLGCSHPTDINNTYMLELNGWSGLNIDILDFSDLWKNRKTPFLNLDCFEIDYNQILSEHFEDKIIDYLNLDMEKCGDRFRLLEKIINSEFEFKSITLEHDSYIGQSFIEQEKLPQRKLLEEKGFFLLCADVSPQKFPNFPFEDWWINKKYFDIEKLSMWKSNQLSCDKIIEQAGINFSEYF